MKIPRQMTVHGMKVLKCFYPKGLFHSSFAIVASKSRGQGIAFQHGDAAFRLCIVGRRCYATDSSGKERSSENKGILEEIRIEAAKISSKLGKYNQQFKETIEKAQLKIQEANAKIKLQENEANKIKYDTDLSTHKAIDNLPSRMELRRTQFARKLEFYFDSLQETIFTATKALNDVTGYSAIQKLRNSIKTMEDQLREQRLSLKRVKTEYERVVKHKTESQNEINALLQRKSSWDPADLEHFTKIYRENQNNVKLEIEKSQELKTMEKKTESLENDLYNAILTRYHEEQVWSDKIRRTSTWGTFLLMGVNILLFVVVQIVFEPWKRRRLVRAFEDKVKVALEDYKTDQDEKFDKLLKLLEQNEAAQNIVEKHLGINESLLEETEEPVSHKSPELREKNDAHVQQDIGSAEVVQNNENGLKDASKISTNQSLKHQLVISYQRLKSHAQSLYDNKLYIPSLASSVQSTLLHFWHQIRFLLGIEYINSE